MFRGSLLPTRSCRSARPPRIPSKMKSQSSETTLGRQSATSDRLGNKDCLCLIWLVRRETRPTMSQSKFLNYGLTFKPDSTALLINQMLPELGAYKGPPSLFWKHTLDCGRVKSTTKSWVCFVGSNLNTSNWKDYSNQSNFTLCGKDSGSRMSGRVFARKLLAKLSGTSIYMPRCADSNDIESKSCTESLFHLFWRIKSSLTSKFKQQ